MGFQARADMPTVAILHTRVAAGKTILLQRVAGLARLVLIILSGLEVSAVLLIAIATPVLVAAITQASGAVIQDASAEYESAKSLAFNSH